MLGRDHGPDRTMLELDAREAICGDRAPAEVVERLVRQGASRQQAQEIVTRISAERHAVYRTKGIVNCVGGGLLLLPMFAIIKYLVLPMHEKGATLAVKGIPYFWELVSFGLGLLAVFLVGLGVKRITRGGQGERKQIWD